MTPAEILNKAADLIDEKGLAKNSYQTNDGRFCAVGAIGQVASGIPHRGVLVFDKETRIKIRMLVRNDPIVRKAALMEHGEEPTGNIPKFNDSAYVKNKRQVSSLLRRIAKRL